MQLEVAQGKKAVQGKSSRRAGFRSRAGKLFLAPRAVGCQKGDAVSVACRNGGMVDAMDSKSVVLTDVWVRVPLPVLTDNRRGPKEPTERAG